LNKLKFQVEPAKENSAARQRFIEMLVLKNIGDNSDGKPKEFGFVFSSSRLLFIESQELRYLLNRRDEKTNLNYLDKILKL